ncbi:MAG: hypothetical protein WAU68_07150, partial [Vitreimonas sp.]
LVAEPGGAPTPLSDPHELVVRRLEPGQSATIYVWSMFDYYTDWGFYSNLGEPVVNVHSAVNDPLRRDAFSQFMDEWMPGLLFALLLVGLSAMGIVAGIFETYLRQLLSDESWYREEKSRFEQNPRKFSLKLKSP